MTPAATEIFRRSLGESRITTAVIRERTRRPLESGFEVLAEVLVSHGREGRVATWVITAQPRSAGGDRYEIVDLIEPAAIDGLLRLTLDTSKQYTVRNLTLQAPDLVGLHVLGLALVPLACLQFALLLALEFPDAAGDRAVGKRTCVVRLGLERATRLYVGTVAAAYVSLPALVAAGLPHEIALAAAGPAPVALWRLTRTYAGDCQRPERWESLTFWAVMLLAGTAVMIGSHSSSPDCTQEISKTGWNFPRSTR